MKWISISDKLPPLDTDVLVFFEEYDSQYKSHMQVSRMYERMLSDYFETEESKKDILRWTIWGTINYWMPLPELPKVKESGSDIKPLIAPEQPEYRKILHEELDNEINKISGTVFNE